jgi:hypothetical protein
VKRACIEPNGMIGLIRRDGGDADEAHAQAAA